MSLTGLFTLLKSLAKLAEVFRWAYKTFNIKKAESQHAQNVSSIDAAVDAARGVSDSPSDGSRPTPPKTS